MKALAVIAWACFVLFQGIDGQGAIYTRWGRTTCPYGAIELYKGFMAGPLHNEQGGGNNYLCMHNNPTRSARLEAKDKYWSGSIGGVEYEIPAEIYAEKNPLSWQNNYGEIPHNEDAPCVVCLRPNTYAMLMIPGRNDCGGTDMQFEYTGFIASQAKEHEASTDFICLDEAPEALQGGNTDENHALIYVAQVFTGSLPGPPYQTHEPVHCTVCTL